ncbi:MAG: phosphoglucosamine mutase [Candidatus Aminicenantes bacterium]|nr:phosphoglucosamine mutase [Candidatus Aminicenantes bacterium]
MKKISSLKISISGVRGIIGDSLTPQLAGALSQAFGTYVGGGPVIVGRDARPSGPMLLQAVIAGLLSSGCQPIDVGICPIPSFLFLAKEAKSSGGISVTASHNPKEWNGLKFISRDGLYLTPHQMEEFLDIYHQGDFTYAPPDRLKALRAESQPVEPHLKKLLGYFNADLIRRRKFKVALDCGNGAGAILAPRFLQELGCETVVINAVPDGSFAHGGRGPGLYPGVHFRRTRPLIQATGEWRAEGSSLDQSEPLPENIKEICRTVVKSRADVGFVQDADADRLAIVNDKGRPLGEELTLALAAQYMLGKKKGSVVCNLSTTRAIDDIAAARKAPVFRTKIGEINVVEKVLTAEPAAVIAGEGNGGVILPGVHPCRDSFAGMGLILEYLAASGRTISALQKRVPRYVMIKDKIEGSAEQGYRLVGLLKKRYEGEGRISLLDGLKIDFPDHWIHVRPSNTEPIIRVISEARTESAAKAAIRRLKKEIEELKNQI